MPCTLLHIVEQPEPRPYADPDLMDLIGSYPQVYCAAYTPPKPLRTSESVRCLRCEGPCWRGSETCDLRR